MSYVEDSNVKAKEDTGTPVSCKDPGWYRVSLSVVWEDESLHSSIVAETQGEMYKATVQEILPRRNYVVERTFIIPPFHGPFFLPPPQLGTIQRGGLPKELPQIDWKNHWPDRVGVPPLPKVDVPWSNMERTKGSLQLWIEHLRRAGIVGAAERGKERNSG